MMTLVDGEVPYCRRIHERAIVTYGQATGPQITEVLFVFGKKERWYTGDRKDSLVIAAKSIDGFWKNDFVEYKKQKEIPFQDIFSYEPVQNAAQAVEYLSAGQ